MGGSVCSIRPTEHLLHATVDRETCPRWRWQHTAALTGLIAAHRLYPAGPGSSETASNVQRWQGPCYCLLSGGWREVKRLKEFRYSDRPERVTKGFANMRESVISMRTWVCILEDKDEFAGQREERPSRQRKKSRCGGCLVQFCDHFAVALSGFHGTLFPHLHIVTG